MTTVPMLKGANCSNSIQIRTVQWRGVTADFLNGWDMSGIPWGQLWWSGSASSEPAYDSYSAPGWFSYNGGNGSGCGRSQVLVGGSNPVQYMVAATWGYGNTVCLPAACTSTIQPCAVIELVAPPDAESYPPPTGCMTTLYYFLCMVGAASLPNRGTQSQGYCSQAPFLPNLATWLNTSNLYFDWWMNGANFNQLSGFNINAVCDPQPGTPTLDPFDDVP
ncbi:MAG: hypothetical protein ACLQU4_11980 [Limisphaerales bacterium]